MYDSAYARGEDVKEMSKPPPTKRGRRVTMATRANQKSVYFTEEVERAMKQFNEAYPRVRLTDAINASLRCWLREALQRGIDGNLDPLPLTKPPEQDRRAS